jgi:hypothetical protein
VSSDELLGVIWSPNISYGQGIGYALVITVSKIVGARKSGVWHAYERFLGPSIKYPTSDADRAKAQEVANELIADKEFGMPKESIVKILYKKPGFYSRGRLTFQTASQQIVLDIPFLQGASGANKTVGIIVASLNVFAPDRFYDEDTGALVRDELLQKLADKKKHWW